jgi:hypothetical protein
MLKCLFIGCALFEGREACYLMTLDFFSMKAKPSKAHNFNILNPNWTILSALGVPRPPLQSIFRLQIQPRVS